MNTSSSGIMDRAVNEMPIAVIDFETTGLTPGLDRVVEVSVVRMEPGKYPELAFDTLVNPVRSVAATEIHGITDEDVADAPVFEEIAGDFVRAISDCIVAAYNVYFDIKFLAYELNQAGLEGLPPHLCLMYMRPMLGLGKRCTLGDACNCHGIPHSMTHTSAGDADAAAHLMTLYLEKMKRSEISTFGDLAQLKNYKFVRSFENRPFSKSLVADISPSDSVRSRSFQGQTSLADRKVSSSIPKMPSNPLAEYWDALKAALADFQITDDELCDLQRKKSELQLKDEQVRMLHARLFAGVIGEFIADKWLDGRECKVLHRVHSCLSKLGWAPGE